MTSICFSVSGSETSPILLKFGLIACFSPVINVDISLTSTGSQKLGVGKWKKMGVLAIQKVAKTGNNGKKTPVAGSIDYARYLSMQN